MRLLAKVPLLADYDRGFKTCAVHQQTQRTYAIGEADDGNHAVVLLDANLQVIATVEATGDVPEDADEANESIRDVAVHGDQVIVLTTNGLRLLDLDGRCLRTIAAGRFQNSQAVTASHGRAFVVVDDDDSGKVLHVIDLQSGDFLQSVRFDLQGEVSAVRVDGDEIYIAGVDANEVMVLQLAGSA